MSGRFLPGSVRSMLGSVFEARRLLTPLWSALANGQDGGLHLSVEVGTESDEWIPALVSAGKGKAASWTYELSFHLALPEVDLCLGFVANLWSGLAREADLAVGGWGLLGLSAGKGRHPDRQSEGKGEGRGL